MPAHLGLLLISAQLYFGKSLKVDRFLSGQPRKLTPEVQHAGAGWLPNETEWLPNTTYNLHVNASHVPALPTTQFVGCNSTSCSVDTAKMKSKVGEVLILILGCSIDIHAIGFLCNAAYGTTVDSMVKSAPFSYLSHCTVGGTTVAYTFHPGASPPPYSGDYNPSVLGTTRDILLKSKLDVMAKFGKEPTAIVVESSLWDVANWWGKIGRPPYPYPVTLVYPYLQEWCNKDVPQLLADVSTIYPHSRIAFRTAPTVFPGYDMSGQNPLIIEKMVHCLDFRTDAYGKLYGAFDVIDYHKFVDTVLQTAGGLGASYYQDSLHPGKQLSLMYMNNVMNWVQWFLSAR